MKLMGRKTTTAIDDKQLKDIITTLKTSFTYTDIKGKVINVRPNQRVATVLMVQANTGLRIGDILELKSSDIKLDNGRYMLDIIEEKTSKKRTFTINTEVYNYLLNYCVDNEIKRDATIFNITAKTVQTALKHVVNYLGYKDYICTHSFRKFFANTIYTNNNHNLRLVQELLQHSNIRTTQQYLTVSTQDVENALNNHCFII